MRNKKIVLFSIVIVIIGLLSFDFLTTKPSEIQMVDAKIVESGQIITLTINNGTDNISTLSEKDTFVILRVSCYSFVGIGTQPEWRIPDQNQDKIALGENTINSNGCTTQKFSAKIIKKY